MKCKSYKSFSSMVTRRINILFASQRMRAAMVMAQWAYSCDIEEGNLDAPMPFDRMRNTVMQFGSDEEFNAYCDLVSLMKDNPEYKKLMNMKTKR